MINFGVSHFMSMEDNSFLYKNGPISPLFMAFVFCISQLGLCPEGANHLQEMKDTLISISNELLDNLELTPERMETLRQDRFVENTPHNPRYAPDPTMCNANSFHGVVSWKNINYFLKKGLYQTFYCYI